MAFTSRHIVQSRMPYCEAIKYYTLTFSQYSNPLPGIIFAITDSYSLRHFHSDNSRLPGCYIVLFGK
jgi:hypothetical protein